MTQATGGIVSTGKPHLIGEEGSHCVPFIEHTTEEHFPE